VYRGENTQSERMQRQESNPSREERGIGRFYLTEGERGLVRITGNEGRGGSICKKALSEEEGKRKESEKCQQERKHGKREEKARLALPELKRSWDGTKQLSRRKKTLS